MIDGEPSRGKTGKYRPAIGLRDTTTYIIIKKKESSYFTQEEARWDVSVGRDGLLSPPYEYFRDYFYKPPTFQVLADMREKIFYTLASMCKNKNDEVYGEVCDVIRTYCPAFRDLDVWLESKAYDQKNHTEEEMIEIFGAGNYIEKEGYWIAWKCDFGFCARHILSDFLKQEGITITEFITNKRYLIIVDDAKEHIYRSMKECGLINMKVIEKEYAPDPEGMI
jgi:hypothetical protein